MSSEIINITPLKKNALKLEDPLKTLILTEANLMSKDRYLENTSLWLKILKIEGERGK